MSYQLPNHSLQHRLEHDLELGEIPTDYSCMRLIPIIRKEADSESITGASSQTPWTHYAGTADDENPFIWHISLQGPGASPGYKRGYSAASEDISVALHDPAPSGFMVGSEIDTTESSKLAPPPAPLDAVTLKRLSIAFHTRRKVHTSSSVQLPLPHPQTPKPNRRIKMMDISEIPKKKIVGRSKKTGNVLKERQINVMTGKPPTSPKSHRKKAERSAYSKIGVLSSPRKKGLLGKRHSAFHGAGPTRHPKAIPFCLLTTT